MHDDNDEWWCCLGWGWGRSKTSHKKNIRIWNGEQFSNFKLQFSSRGKTSNQKKYKLGADNTCFILIGNGWIKLNEPKDTKWEKWGQIFVDSNKKQRSQHFQIWFDGIRKRFDQRIQELSILNFDWVGMFGRGRSKTFNQKNNPGRLDRQHIWHRHLAACCPSMISHHNVSRWHRQHA